VVPEIAVVERTGIDAEGRRCGFRTRPGEPAGAGGRVVAAPRGRRLHLLVGPRDPLELAFGIGVVAVDVGVERASQPPEGGRDLALGRGRRDAEHRIRVEAVRHQR